MTNPKPNNLKDFLTDKEWYDNSKLSTILACARKGFYSYEFQGGLSSSVGHGANFGTCIHGGAAIYYYWWGRRSEPERRLLAIRGVAALHESLFVGPAREGLTSKHTIESAINIFDNYCNQHLVDDSTIRPIEVELAGAIEIAPHEGESFRPFWYVFRIDGIHQRLTYGDYWIREMKTTSGGVQRELSKLRIARQPRGYLWCMRQFPGPHFTGVMPDVVGVMAKTLEAQRDFYPKSVADGESWRAQTVNIVQHWRALQDSFALKGDPNLFVQNTGECFAYGQCAFYDLCQYGHQPALIGQYQPNTWNPLDLVDLPLERDLVQTPYSIKETHPI